MATPQVDTYYEPKTGTWQYVVADPSSKEAVIIDPVLDYDAATSSLSTASADAILAGVAKGGLTITRILETHAHADHLTASRYLQAKLKQASGGGAAPAICIGRRIEDVQKFFGARYGVAQAELTGAFDHTFDDNETFAIGALHATVLHLPGHTPDHIGYVIGENVFTGDSIFNADVGSARCDFQGGSATQLFASIQKLLSLPPGYRLYTGHDYPPEGRDAQAFTTVADQRAKNKHVKEGTAESQFVEWRTGRDSGLNEPKLIHHAMQVNIRGGKLPSATGEGYRFLHVPVKVPESFAA